ncbi:hypothetical protein D9758_011553 [Tetrapyrgos nigripes]|uniref:EthD domain-containing protein n=1 Tax=Tetrapyrgos nigripes TaxID=182062 RepID=A0A8H5FQ03_9AGAR|nr:hypothetical protein D9758_011553 [Tetrapyrgos nigripes]
MSNPTLRTDRVRLLVLITKNSSISREEFERYWLEHHSQLLLSLEIFKKNVLKYEQLHINQQTKDLLQSLGAALIECDGVVILEAESYEKLFETFNDARFKAIIEPNEKKFLDPSRTKIIPLDFVAFIDK